jgi:hypothetical protein
MVGMRLIRLVKALAGPVLFVLSACGESPRPPVRSPTRYVTPPDTHACARDARADCEDQCAQGNPASCTTLGELLAAATSKGDEARAFTLFEKACGWDHGRACFLAAEQVVKGAAPPADAREHPACLAANDPTHRLRPLLARGCELKDVDACLAFASKLRVDTCVIGIEGSRWALERLAGLCAEGEMTACTGCIDAALRPRAHAMDIAGFGHARFCFQHGCSGEDEVACAAYQIHGPDGWYDVPAELRRIATRLDRQCKGGTAANTQACTWGTHFQERASKLEREGSAAGATSGKRPAFAPPSPTSRIAN